MERFRFYTLFIPCFCFLYGALWSKTACAADTVEPFVKGASNYEFYGGIQGIGCSKIITGETVLGFGLTDRIASTVVLHTVSSPNFIAMESGFSFGLFGNVLDTRHFDMDFYFSFGSDGSVTPGMELNFDLEQDLKKAGLYLRVAEHISGEAAEKGDHRSFTIQGIIGTYFTVTKGVQLLGEIHMSKNLLKNHRRIRWEKASFQGVALGVNVQIHKRIELINQVFMVPGNPEQPTNYGVSTGILVTME